MAWSRYFLFAWCAVYRYDLRVETGVDQQKIKEYEARVIDWMGSQGVLFQLRYARIISGGSLLKQLGFLLMRVVALLLVCAVIGYFALNRYFKSASYTDKMISRIENSFGLEEIESKSVSKSKGNMNFSKLYLKGGEDCFFYELEAKGIGAPVKFMDGITTEWNPSQIKMDLAEFSLKGGGSPEEMEKSFAGVVESLKGEGITSILINDFSCDWGYTKVNYGRISNSKLNANLVNGVWEISLLGGTFQQNWLQGFSLNSGELKVTPTGIIISSLDLTKQESVLKLRGEIKGPASTPLFDLNGEFEYLEVSQLIDLDYVDVSRYLQGHISGDLKLSGSSNQKIRMTGQASISEGDGITIRERWPILKALSIIDMNHSFRKVDFTTGSFQFATENNTLELNEIDFVESDHVLLKGALSVRLPNQQEAADLVGIVLTENFSNKKITDSAFAQRLEDERISLTDALGRANEGETSIFTEMTLNESRDIEENTNDAEEEILLKEMRIHRINGNLSIAVLKATFEDNERLAKAYPANEDGWCLLPIEVKNSTFASISEVEGDEILGVAKNKKSEIDFE